MPVMDFPSSPVNGQTTTDGRYYFDSSVGSTGAWRSTPLPVGGLPAGSIIQWGSGTLPANWLLCDGSAVSRSTYSSLFAAIGTQYGAGDGTTTFNLPDIPNGSAAGIVGEAISRSVHTVTTTLADIAGASVANVLLRAGRTYRITFSSAQVMVTGGTNPRMAFDFIVGSTNIDRHYFGSTVNIGDPFNVETTYTPSADQTVTVKVAARVDVGSGTFHFYADATGSKNTLTIEDLGEGVSSTVRHRSIIKATAGWTAGDSELATRIGVLEQNPSITGTLTVAGTATFNGYVKAPNTPAFLAQPTSNNNASNAVGVFTSVTLNAGNCYSTSTGRFTAPVAGSYMFTGAAMPQANTVMEFWRFRKNGVKIGPWTYAINGDQILSQTLVIPLAVNDYVDMFFVSDGYEYLFTNFSGHFIG